MVGFSVFPDSRILTMTDDPNSHLFHIIFIFIPYYFHIFGLDCNSSFLNTMDITNDGLASGRFFLTDPQVQQVSVGTRLFLLSLQKLGEIDNRGKIWRTRPKHHGLSTLQVADCRGADGIG